MGINRKNSFINRANKNAHRNFDAKKLDPLQMNLLRYNIPTIREREIIRNEFHTRNNTRVPDLIETKNNIIIEHDTVKVHGELGLENEKTNRRNGDYMRAKILFCVINEDLCRELGLDESKLSVYLYYHKFMELNAQKEI